MGRIVTPTYRIEYRDNLLSLGKSAPDMISKTDRNPVYAAAWDRRKTTTTNLEEWRIGMNKSFQKDGANYHISKSYDIIPHIYFARIVRQRDNKVMCETKAPPFEVV